MITSYFKDNNEVASGEIQVVNRRYYENKYKRK